MLACGRNAGLWPKCWPVAEMLAVDNGLIQRFNETLL